MCFNVVLEVSVERQHEEGWSEEDGGTGVRTSIDGGKRNGRGWHRKGEGERERKRLERKRKREGERNSRACLKRVASGKTLSRKRHTVREALSLFVVPADTVSFSSAPTSAFSRPHLPLYI